MPENKENRKGPKSIRFPEEIEAKIEKEAIKKERSFSWIVIKIVSEYFKPKPKK